MENNIKNAPLGTAKSENANHQGFEFRGSGTEFFNIWIVNLLLSIVTLGIYSAWAKVRTNRYFYGNTYVDDHNFEYHAEPLQILKGRIIAVLFLVVYLFASSINTALSMIFALALFVLTPWVIVNGLRFNARMSSYRGIHFNFRGTYGGAIFNFFLLPILSVLSLGLAFPYAAWKQTKYYLTNHSYGKSLFKFRATAGAYYKAVGFCLLLVIMGCVLVYALFGSEIQEVLSKMEGGASHTEGPPSLGFAVIAIYGLSFLAFLIYQGMAYNIAMNHLSVQSNQFASKLNVMHWVWIVVSNVVLILCTLGIFYPWAQVRAIKYRCRVTAIDVQDSERFIADEQKQQSALGEEIGEAFDVGVGI